MTAGRYYRLLLFCGILFLPGWGIAQSRVDSLLAITEALPLDTNRVKSLLSLVNTLRDNDNRTAIRYAESARVLADSLDYLRGKAYSRENLAWFHYRLGDYSSCMDISLVALQLMMELNDKSGMAKCYNNLGAVLLQQNQESEAIHNFRKASVMASECGDRMQQVRSLNNMSYCYLRLGLLDSAFRTNKMSMRLISSKSQLNGFSYRTLGDIYSRKGNFDSARYFFENGLMQARQSGNTFMQVSIYYRFAQLYLDKGLYREAEALLIPCLRLAIDGSYRDEQERAYRMLAEVKQGLGDSKAGYRYLKLHTDLRDSLDKVRDKEKMSMLRQRYEAEMDKVRIGLLNKDVQLKEEQISQQRMLLYFTLGCLTLFIFLIVLLMVNNRLRVRINSELSRKNSAIESQARELITLNDTKDKLFGIMSHDLRSPLANLRSLIELLASGGLSRQEFESLVAKLRLRLDAVTEDLNNMLMWTQSQMSGLAIEPERVEIHHIVEEKFRLVHESANEKGIELVNDVPPGLFAFVDLNHLQLIIRNLLVNAVKFNRLGGRIRVAAMASEGMIRISVSDTGIGMSSTDLARLFNRETTFSHRGTRQERGTGLGLMLVKEFVEKNGGTIFVESEENVGSTFSFTVRPFVNSSDKVHANQDSVLV